MKICCANERKRRNQFNNIIARVCFNSFERLSTFSLAFHASHERWGWCGFCSLCDFPFFARALFASKNSSAIRAVFLQKASSVVLCLLPLSSSSTVQRQVRRTPHFSYSFNPDLVLNPDFYPACPSLLSLSNSSSSSENSPYPNHLSPITPNTSNETAFCVDSPWFIPAGSSSQDDSSLVTSTSTYLVTIRDVCRKTERSTSSRQL